MVGCLCSLNWLGLLGRGLGRHLLDRRGGLNNLCGLGRFSLLGQPLPSSLDGSLHRVGSWSGLNGPATTLPELLVPGLGCAPGLGVQLFTFGRQALDVVCSLPGAVLVTRSRQRTTLFGLVSDLGSQRLDLRGLLLGIRQATTLGRGRDLDGLAGSLCLPGHTPGALSLIITGPGGSSLLVTLQPGDVAPNAGGVRIVLVA